MSMARVASNCVPTVRGLRERCNGSLRYPAVREHRTTYVRFNDLEDVIEIVPREIGAPENRQGIAQIFVMNGGADELRNSGKRRTNVIDVHTPIGLRSLHARLNLEAHR